MICSRSLLLIYLTYSSVYLLTPNSNFSLLLPPLVTLSCVSASLSLFLSCTDASRWLPRTVKATDNQCRAAVSRLTEDVEFLLILHRALDASWKYKGVLGGDKLA